MRRRSKVIPSLAVASQVAGALVLVALATGQGTTHAASTLIDAADDTDLRNAISSLNFTGNGEADTITLTSASPYVLACGTNEDNNNDGDIDYLSDDDLKIVFAGPGQATIEIDQSGPGCTTDRVIHHSGSGKLTLEGVQITGGDLTTVPVFRANGGGILSDGAGTLNLVDVTITGNAASAGGMSPKGPGGGYGGGIAIASGSATITNSVVTENTAGNGLSPATGSGGRGGVGGGIFLNAGTTLVLVDTDVHKNQAGNGGQSMDAGGGNGGDAGGIYASGVSMVNITGGNIGGATPGDGNTAGDGGTSASGDFGRRGGNGGGIFASGELTINGTTITNNSAGMPSAGIAASAGGGGNGGGISAIGIVEITGASISDNNATSGQNATGGAGGTGGSGGGVYVEGLSSELSLTDSQVTGNQSGDGGTGDLGGGAPAGPGGGVVLRGARFTMIDSTVSGNTTGDGGDYSPSIGGPGGSAAGILVAEHVAADPTVLIERSTISGNTTGIGGSGATTGFGGDGGGLELRLGNASGIISASTISGNTAGRQGGGLYATGGIIAIEKSTLDTNTAGERGGGLYSSGVPDIEFVASTVSSNESPMNGANLLALGGGGGPIDLIRTFVADPLGGGSNCGGTSGGGDSLEHQASGSFSCGSANTTTILGLGVLADNGGPTETRLPIIAGPAIDAIALANCVESVDQRGKARPRGSGCDIGAVEVDFAVSAANDNASTLASPVVIDVLDNDSAINTSLDPASVSKTAGPSDGSVTFSSSTGKATYTPDNGFAGIDQFTYQVCGDSQPGVCDTAEVTVTVTQPPDATPGVVTITPARILESRNGPGFTTFDGDQQGIGRRTQGQITTVKIAGRAGIPTDADAAIINIGAITPDNNGFITAYPCNKPQPGSSTLNYTTGTTIANGATIKLSPQGTVCIYTHRAMDLIIDVTGYTPNSDGLTTITPARILESRSGSTFKTIDGDQQGIGRRTQGQITTVKIAGRAGIPTDADAAIINIGAITPDNNGFITAYPCNKPQPGSSTLNYTTGTTIANGATIKLSPQGTVCIYTHRAMDLIIDVTGYTPNSDGLTTITPARILESRSGSTFKTIDGDQQGIGRRTQGQITTVKIAGRAGIPTDADAAIINIGAITPDNNGFITAYPCNKPQPGSSTLNYTTGTTIANGATIKLSPQGTVCIYTHRAMDLIIDVTGYTPNIP